MSALVVSHSYTIVIPTVKQERGSVRACMALTAAKRLDGRDFLT